MNAILQSYPMMQNTMLWYTVAFVIFCGIAWRYMRKPLLAAIDGEILKIGDEIERAQKLRAEAEATLAEYKKKSVEALAEAKEIVRYAREEAVELKKQAEADLKTALARHEQQAAERIRLAETEAVAAVRAVAVETAMDLARATLTAQADKTGALTDQAIMELPKLAAAKAKAA